MIRYGGVISGQEEIDAVTSVLNSGNWACGEVTKQFEAEAAKRQGSAYSLFVNSGSSALLLALAALPDNSVVAMPALQFPTLYSAAVRLGHRPLLVDVDDTLNMDPDALDELIEDTPSLNAVAFVHMAGNPSNIAEVTKLCDIHGLLLVEDVCEAFGATHSGVTAGNFGLTSATSTHGAHHISTGEGGLVFTSNERAYKKMHSLRDWGRAYGAADIPGYYPGYVFSELGFNLHATDIQAALGIVQLKKLDEFITQRNTNYLILRQVTEHLPFKVPYLATCTPSWYTFPMLTASEQERNLLGEFLAERGIESRPIVAGNMARQPLPGAYYKPGDYPYADKWFERGIWVSVHPKLTEDDLRYIRNALDLFWSGA